MKRETVAILACPVCKGELDLAVTAEVAGEVTSGQLHCATCRVDYPIKDGIPNLIPPETASPGSS